MLMFTRQIAGYVIPCMHIAAETCALPSCYNIQVRYRKSFKLGRAPSKDRDYFKKFHPTTKDLKETKFLYQDYNFLLKSLVAAFQEELVVKDSQGFTNEKGVWNEEAYHEMCMQYNEAENRRLQEIRSQRMEEENRMSKIRRAEQWKEEETKRLEKEDEARSFVEKTIAESAEWINSENMDEKIIEAIDNPINYNYAVNRAGLIVKRTALVLPPDEDSYVAMETSTR